MEKNWRKLRLGKKLRLSMGFSKLLVSQEGMELGDQEKDGTSVAASAELSVAWKSLLLTSGVEWLCAHSCYVEGHRKIRVKPVPNKPILVMKSIIQHKWHQECRHRFPSSGMQGLKQDLLEVCSQKFKWHFLIYFYTSFRGINWYKCLFKPLVFQRDY